MKIFNTRHLKLIISLICCFCFFTSFAASVAVADETVEEKRELTISQYYPETGNTKKNFNYFLVPDAFVEGYNSLYITELSKEYGKLLEIPDVISDKIITDVFLMDFDEVEEVKLGDKTMNMLCVYPEKNYDGTPGKYADAFSEWSDSFEVQSILDEEARQAEPKNTIKKLIVGKAFQVESFTQGWFFESSHTDVLADVYSYSTEWKVAQYENLEEIDLSEENPYFKVHSPCVYSKDYTELLWILPGKLDEMTTFTPKVECTTINADFVGADNLKEVVLTDNIIHIGTWSSAFDGCKNLTSLTLGKNLEEIGMFAFRNTLLQGELVFPKTMRTIGMHAFEGTMIERVSFENCPDFNFGRFSRSVFDGCAQLKEVVLPENLKVITQKLFRNCVSLESVNWSDSIETINGGAFRNCVNLTNFEAPNNLKRISSRAFKGCTALEKVTLNKKLKKIKDNAFSGCSKIKKVTLPAKLKEVKENAFINCKGLKKIIVKGKNTLLHAKSIGYLTKANGKLKVNKNIIIVGKKGSVAQNYARVNKIKFKLLK